MKMKLLLLQCAFGVASAIAAQTAGISTKQVTTKALFSDVATAYVDSLQQTAQRVIDVQGIDVEELDPYYFQLLTTPTLYNVPLRQAFRLAETEVNTKYASEATQRQILINKALLQAYTEHPQFITSSEANFSEQRVVVPDNSVKPQPTATIAELAAPKTAEETPFYDPALVIVKPNFWKFKGNYSLQFMQNHVSENWYKGGESNYSLHTGVKLNLTYNNKQKVVFENTLEMKIGFRSSESDTINKFKTTDDLIRLTNKLGLRATNHWYYTVMLQSWTQFYHGYKSNQRRVYSDFMSPFQTVFSIGMNYKLEKKKFKLSVDISPLALNYTSVSRRYLAESFGIKAGHTNKTTFGSALTANMQCTLVPNVTWHSRLYGFTNYHYAQVEWENTFNFTINKFLSSKLFLYPRFDDSRKRKQNESYLQFNEWLSVGLNLSF